MKRELRGVMTQHPGRVDGCLGIHDASRYRSRWCWGVPGTSLRWTREWRVPPAAFSGASRAALLVGPLGTSETPFFDHLIKRETRIPGEHYTAIRTQPGRLRCQRVSPVLL